MKNVHGSHLRKLGFSFLLVVLNRLVITIASFEAYGGIVIAELLDFKVFRHAFYASFARYDVGWYAQIAHNGYLNEKSSAFFPLYPLIMKGVSDMTGLSYKVSGQIVSMVCFFISLWLVQVLSEQSDILRFTSNRERTGRFIACIIAFNPFSFFYTIAYTESLFLMLTLLFMLSITRKKWLCAGFCGLFAGLARNTGVLLALIFLFEYLREILPETEEKKLLGRCRHYIHAFWLFIRGFNVRYFYRYRTFYSIFLIPVGAIAYFVYLYCRFGSFDGPVRSQSLFGRSSMFPVLTLLYGFHHGLDKLLGVIKLGLSGQSYIFHYYVLQILSVCSFIFAAVYLLNRMPLSYNLFMIASLLLPLSKPAYTGVVDYFVSFPRYTITLFPYFAALAGVLRGSRRAFIFYLAGSVYLLIIAVIFWCQGYFMA